LKSQKAEAEEQPRPRSPLLPKAEEEESKLRRRAMTRKNCSLPHLNKLQRKDSLRRASKEEAARRRRKGKTVRTMMDSLWKTM